MSDEVEAAPSSPEKRKSNCGQIFIPELGRKIWAHPRRGESCPDCRARILAAWKKKGPKAEVPGQKVDAASESTPQQLQEGEFPLT
jgi:DNA-directed RNA polymerase subunit RPC12/RpoP